MTRHFGNPTRGLPLVKQTALSLGATRNTGAEVIQLPVGARSARRPTSSASQPSDFLSVPGAPYVVRRPWLQMAIDVAAVLSAAFFVFVTGVGVVAAFFLLFCPL